MFHYVRRRSPPIAVALTPVPHLHPYSLHTNPSGDPSRILGRHSALFSPFGMGRMDRFGFDNFDISQRDCNMRNAENAG